ncbi:MAG: MBL fold metallo-hydrolase [Bryobacteraceae bacterium]|nr:MBL fold metallo-hydrolase [Bryobacteraceae bacterium]
MSKWKLWVPVILLAGLLALSQTPAGGVKEIAPGVWVRLGDRTRNQPANAGWVIFKDYVLVIDANFPWGAKEVLAEVRKTSAKPIRFVFNTHYHGDHAYGGSIFTDQGAQIVCTSDCGVESTSKGQASWDKNTATGEFSLKPYKLAHPTITFGDSLVFDDGEHRVEMRKMGPGHSKGDAVAWLPKEKILFTGDMCVNWGTGNNVADADADHDNWLRALDRMAALAPATVVVGHGTIGGMKDLRAQHAYLADMVDAVRQGLAAGKSEEEVGETDLTRHPIGASKAANTSSLKAVYRKLKK